MIDFAYAADVAPPSFIAQMTPFIIILLIFYLLIMRPQQRKYKAHQQLLSELKRGDKVITSSGIVGKITKVGDRFFGVEIAPNVEIEVERSAVSSRAETQS